MILVTQGDETARWQARQYLEDRAVGTSEGIFWNMKISFAITDIIPDILYTLYLSMLQNVMGLKTSCL